MKFENPIAGDILNITKPIPLFSSYLKTGAYPYFIENEQAYPQKLLNTINLIIESDINAVENLNYSTLVKLKKLLKAIATSAPFIPNVTKLSEHIGISRNTLIHAIKILQRAGLVIELYKDTSGIGALTKPEKLFLNNTNLMYILAKENVNVGNLRETFFLNQIQDLYPIHLSEKGDFIVNQKYIFEVGGKNKTRKQIAGIENSYIVKDDIEIGFSNFIPVWLFGFLY